jgi:hypothetical protein
MRHLLHTIMLLAFAPIVPRSYILRDNRAPRNLPPPRVGGAGESTIPPVCNAIAGTPWPALLRTRRRMRNRLKFQQGHWQRTLAPVECISVDGDWAEVTRTDGSSESGPKDLVLARAR